MPLSSPDWTIVLSFVRYSYQRDKLQRIQNTTACLVIGLKRLDHVTPILTWTNLRDDEPVPCKRDNWDQSILVLQKLWLETMTMKVSMQKSQKTLLIAVNFITSENENCIFLPHIFIPMRRDHPQITFQRSMTHTDCVACGPRTTDFSRFPEKRHSTKVLEHLW